MNENDKVPLVELSPKTSSTGSGDCVINSVSVNWNAVPSVNGTVNVPVLLQKLEIGKPPVAEAPVH